MTKQDTLTIPLFDGEGNGVTWAATDTLRPHPINATIYGDNDPIHELVAQIAQSGWIKPLVVTLDGRIISGHRRWRAAKVLGRERLPVERRAFADETAELHGLLLENANRHKTPEQIYRESKHWWTIEAVRAKERQATSAPGIYGGQPLMPDLAEAVKGPTRDKVAARVGKKRSTLVKIKKVVDLADALAEQGNTAAAEVLLETLNEESVDAAAKIAAHPEAPAILEKLGSGEATSLTQAEHQIVAARIRTEPEPLPSGPFRVIVADPPWMYFNRPEDESHRSRNHYPPMEVAAICALPIEALAHDDCILWLWTTNAHLREAFDVVQAWGFETKTILTWAKSHFGTGDWLRGQSEHCLMAVRGKPVVTLTNQSTILHAKNREHSRKPDEFYALVEALCPGSKLELFAREERPEWHTWGAEKEQFNVA
jgi:N6-adenosine-specific RNA methylase IME4